MVDPNKTVLRNLSLFLLFLSWLSTLINACLCLFLGKIIPAGSAVSKTMFFLLVEQLAKPPDSPELPIFQCPLLHYPNVSTFLPQNYSIKSLECRNAFCEINNFLCEDLQIPSIGLVPLV